MPRSVHTARLFLDGPPVCTLHGGEWRLGDFSSNAEFISEVVAAYGAAGHAVIKREGLPPICLDKRAVKNSRGHNRAPIRIAAFAALPDVLRRGCILHIAPMLGGPVGAFVMYVAAPVVIAGVEGIVVATGKVRCQRRAPVYSPNLRKAETPASLPITQHWTQPGGWAALWWGGSDRSCL